jgi:hypothetical protein
MICMPLKRRRPKRNGWAAFAPVLLAAYVCFLAGGPLDHQDVAGHLKSTTHCTACLSASVPDTDARPYSATPELAFSRLSLVEALARFRPDVAPKPGDRSPPSV